MFDEMADQAPSVLLVTSILGAEHMAEALSEHAGVVLELVRTRRAALASLRRYTYDVVMVDATLPDWEVTPADLVWQNAGDAVPLELDLRALGAVGVARMLRNVLYRREQMELLVRESVTRTMADEMRGAITGLLLQSDLVLREQALAPGVEAKVRQMRALADDLRVRLRPAC